MTLYIQNKVAPESRYCTGPGVIGVKMKSITGGIVEAHEIIADETVRGISFTVI